MSIGDYNALMGLRDDAEITTPPGTVVLLPTDSLSVANLKEDAPKNIEVQFSNKKNHAARKKNSTDESFSLHY